jgi:hypothetical protein
MKELIIVLILIFIFYAELPWKALDNFPCINFNHESVLNYSIYNNKRNKIIKNKKENPSRCVYGLFA